MSITRLTMLFQPRSGTSLRLMIGIPSRSSSDGLDRRVLHEVGHDLDVHALVAHALDELQQLRVLLEGQRDVELVGAVRGARRCVAWSSVPEHGEAGALRTLACSSTKPTTR